MTSPLYMCAACLLLLSATLPVSCMLASGSGSTSGSGEMQPSGTTVITECIYNSPCVSL